MDDIFKFLLIRRALQFTIAALVLLSPLKADTFADKLNSAVQRDVVSDLQESMKDRAFWGRVYPLIFREAESSVNVPELDQNFGAWEGKNISQIKIIRKDVFDISEQYELIPFFNDLLRMGNRIQPQTRLNTLRHNLFFAEQDSLKTEYMLANLHYLYDLGIFSEIAFDVEEKADNDVAVSLLLREKFFLQLSASYKAEDDLQIKLMDRNFLGLGQSLKFILHTDPIHRNLSGWESSYTHPNMFSSFLSGSFFYKKLNEERELEIRAERDFLHPLYSNFGGLSYRFSKRAYSNLTDPVNKNEYQLWYARSLGEQDYPRYLYAAASANARLYQQDPAEPAWQDACLGIAAIGMASPEYRYISGISSFLDSNYVPRGFHLQLAGGYEIGELVNRKYLALRFSHSIFHNSGHYLYNEIMIDSFIGRSDYEQNVFMMQPRYISAKRKFGSFEGRGMLNLKLARLQNAHPTHRIILETDNYFGDLKLPQGTGFLGMNLEEHLNTPYQFFGFQLSLFAFVSMAVMEDDSFTIKQRQNVFSQGLGFHFRNPGLIWDFIELKLALNYKDAGAPVPAVSLNLKPASLLENFAGKSPKPIMY
jgi:hypothetical protein